MPTKKKYDHIHQYIPSRAVLLGEIGTALYRCTVSNCRHYVRKESMLGKITRCAHCGDVFTITTTHIMANDLEVCCTDCRTGRRGLATRIEAILGKI